MKFSKVRPYFIYIIIIIVIIMDIGNQFIDIYVRESVPLDTKIDPELMNGILTLSGILFGFSAILAFEQKKEEKWTWKLLIIPLLTLYLSGSVLYDVAIERRKPIEALLYIRASFIATAIITWFLAGARTRA